MPETLDADRMLPAALIRPLVKMLPPVTLPVVLTAPPAGGITLPIKLRPVILPAAETCPPVSKLPPVVLPVTLSVVPTVAALAMANAPLPPNAVATVYVVPLTLVRIIRLPVLTGEAITPSFELWLMLTTLEVPM